MIVLHKLFQKKGDQEWDKINLIIKKCILQDKKKPISIINIDTKSFKTMSKSYPVYEKDNISWLVGVYPRKTRLV